MLVCSSRRRRSEHTSNRARRFRRVPGCHSRTRHLLPMWIFRRTKSLLSRACQLYGNILPVVPRRERVRMRRRTTYAAALNHSRRPQHPTAPPRVNNCPRHIHTRVPGSRTAFMPLRTSLPPGNTSTLSRASARGFCPRNIKHNRVCPIPRAFSCPCATSVRRDDHTHGHELTSTHRPPTPPHAELHRQLHAPTHGLSAMATIHMAINIINHAISA